LGIFDHKKIFDRFQQLNSPIRQAAVQIIEKDDDRAMFMLFRYVLVRV
jgi:hypothetical protein